MHSEARTDLNKQVPGLDDQPYIEVDFPAAVIFLKPTNYEYGNCPDIFLQDNCIIAIQFRKSTVPVVSPCSLCRHLPTISTKTPGTGISMKLQYDVRCT